jgi:hypothetical protein
MITLENDELVFRFPEVHPDARFSLSFQQTLRIPDDGRDYPLPPGLGMFPLRHVDDYGKRVPAQSLKRGGLIMPMYQAEAMWLSFHASGYPFAVKVGAGKVNAVTGDPWTESLKNKPQDYLALPGQPWLDGFCVEKGVIRQFVAAPLGRRGITVEEQLTGQGEWGGVQLLACPLKAARYERLLADRAGALRQTGRLTALCCEEARPLGLGAGGRMRQHIYEDEFNIDDWDQSAGSRCFITILNSADWRMVTGEPMPSSPVDARRYAEAGLPWFDYYSDAPALEGGQKLQGVKSIADAWKPPVQEGFDFAHPITVGPIMQLGTRPVREMPAE